jgi:3-oxoadipate enol-lactonase
MLRILLPWFLAVGLGACASATASRDPEPASAVAAPSRMIDTSVGRLAVYDTPVDDSASPAPVLVLWPSVFADSGIYAPLVQRWRGRLRIILIDGPGHGASGPGPSAGFTMRACADAVKTIMDTLGVASATVGGTSWGGLVGGEFALAYPRATDAVVMMNTPVFSEPGMSDSMIVLGTRVMGSTTFFARQVAKGFFLDDTLQANGPVVRGFFSHLAAQPQSALADAVKAVLVEREALAPRMSAIKAPTLFVTGKHDAMYPADRLQRAARQIPKVRLADVDSRHVSVVDQPEKVGDLIEALVLRR